MFWLAIGCGGASKLDGVNYSAFLVFLPVFLLVSFFLCTSCLFVFLFQEDKRPEVPAGATSAESMPSASPADPPTFIWAAGPVFVGPPDNREQSPSEAAGAAGLGR